jgi:hypothetical protein
MLGQLFDAFSELDVATHRVVYGDDATDDVREELLGLDGVLVWANPNPGWARLQTVSKPPRLG